MSAILTVLELLGGLALFLYGMTAMGAALEKSAGNKLKSFLGHATSNPLKGFLLGLAVTLVVQSSSTTTVMVVGFVNSGLMTLTNCIPVILGSNLGSSVTSWILSLQAIEGGSFFLLNLLKPSAFVPVIAMIGVILYAFQKNAKRKDIGMILLSFSILMFGMDMMSGAVSILNGNEAFENLLIMFSNPILGVLVGTIFTAIIQSSAASIGILQALSTTGAVSYATAVPIIMGQNIGTCISAIISCIGTGKNAKRAAIIHLSFNVIATLIILPLFYLVDFFVDFAFLDWQAGYIGIAIVHTSFKLIALAIISPFSRWLEKLSRFIIRDGKQSEENTLLDERFFAVPSIAIDRSRTVAVTMAEVAVRSVNDALDLLTSFDAKSAERIREMEKKVDLYEDKLGSYLVKLSGHSMTEKDNAEANKLLHVLGDFERISDHAINILESAEEIHDKHEGFSEGARNELRVMTDAVREILNMVLEAFRDDDLEKAFRVEPLEQVIDDLRDYVKKKHVKRLRGGECTIELGFVLTDLLTDLERISDHCSNIAGCMLEIARDELDIHEYLHDVKTDVANEFNKYFRQYSEKYALSSGK